MPIYVCNKNTDENGRHEVHTTTCSYLPQIENRIEIGLKLAGNQIAKKLFNKCMNGILRVSVLMAVFGAVFLVTQDSTLCMI